MAFDATNKVFYNSPAPMAEARDVLLDYIKGKLNDEAGDYFELLNLSSPDRLVVTTPVPDIAAANYEDAKNAPVVFGATGEQKEARISGRNILGIFYKGRRRPGAIMLDSAVGAPDVSDDNPENDNPVDAKAADDTLAGAVRNVVETGRTDLWNLGLLNACISSQSDETGRHFQQVDFLMMTLDNYAP